MDKDKKSEGEEKCCSETGCGGGGCGCGRGGCKAILAVILLLVGGIIGYLAGAHCGMRKMMGCPIMPMSAPAAPTK